MSLLSNQPVRAVPKTQYKRVKPTASQRGLVNARTRKDLARRSKGLCEKCGRGGVPLQAAHLIRRWRIEGKTTVSEVVHLCLDCHRYCDNTSPGRHWLIEFRKRLLEVESHG